MLVGKLHFALFAINREYTGFKIIENITALHAALSQSASAPTAENATKFKNSLKATRELLSNCDSNNAHPTLRMVFDEISATNKLGKGLLKKIEIVLNDNSLTPALAVTGIAKLLEEARTFHNNITLLVKHFRILNLELDVLEPGNYEFGVLLPKKSFDPNLDILMEQFKELNRALKNFYELADDVQTNIKLRTIGSSDEIQLFLDIFNSNTAKAITEAISFLWDLVKEMFLANVIFKQARELLTDKKAKEFDKLIDGDKGLDDRIRKKAEKIVEEYYSDKVKNRKTELAGFIAESMKYFYKNIKSGGRFEINFTEPIPPSEPKKPEALPEGEETTKEKREQYKKSINDYNKEEKKFSLDKEKYDNHMKSIKMITEEFSKIKEIEERDRPKLLKLLEEKKGNKPKE